MYTSFLLSLLAAGCEGKPGARYSGTATPGAHETGDPPGEDTSGGDSGGDTDDIELFSCGALAARVVARGYWDVAFDHPVRRELAVADVDVDGHSDLLVPTFDGVWVGLGDGAGALVELGLFGPEAGGVAALDVDADGLLDLAVMDGDGGLTVLRGTGTGFEVLSQELLGCGTPRYLQANDLDGDGDLDLAGVCGTSGVLVARSEGGSLDIQVLPGTGTAADVRVADLDGDGNVDLLQAGGGTAEQVLLLGDGLGGFRATTLTTTRSLDLVAVADTDGDGDVDIVASNPEDAWLVSLVNDGSGSFTEQLFEEEFGSYDFLKFQAHWLGSGDVDGDGTGDLVLATDEAFGVRLGGDDGLGECSWDWIEDWVDASALGDFDEDGRLDLAVVTTSGVLSIRRQGEGGAFAQATLTGDTSLYPDGAVLIDYNGDGIEDVLAAQGTDLDLWLSEGEDGWVRAWEDDLYGTSGGGVLVSGDLDGDGWTDVVVTDATASDAVVVFRLGEGGVLIDRTPLTLSEDTRGPDLLSLGDLDGDGDLDLVANQSAREKVRVALGDGTGALALAGELDLGFDVDHLAIADFDGDGRQDVAAASSWTEIEVLAWHDDGGLRELAGLRAETWIQGLAVGDVDGDGDADLAVIANDDLAPELWRNDGGGASWTREPLGLSGGSLGLFDPALLDLDGDGVLDVVWLGSDYHALWSCGDGSGAFGAPQELPFRGKLRTTPAVVAGSSPLRLAAVAGNGLSVVAAGE